jgi:hypothetical protein
MQRQGFFIARGENGQKKLVSNEGEVVAGTKNGVRYTLYFGEVARGTAKDIETGLNEKAAADDQKDDAAADDQKTDTADAGDNPPKPEIKPADAESGPRRYLLVKVEFDESLMGAKPAEPVEPEKPAILNEGEAPAETPAEPPAEAKPETPTPDAVPEKAAPADAATPADDAAAPKEEVPPATEEKSSDDAAPKDAAPEESKESSDESGCDEPVVDEAVDPEPKDAAPSPADEAAPKDDGPQPSASTEPTAGDETPEIIPKKTEPSDSEKPVTDTPVTDTPAADPPAATGDEKPAAQVTTPQETAPPVDPKEEAQKQYLQALGKYEAEKSGYADALKSWEDRRKEGEKLAKELSARFGAWYYVISADSFEKLRPSRADVVGPKEEAKPGEANTPPNFDLPHGGIPGLGQ